MGDATFSEVLRARRARIEGSHWGTSPEDDHCDPCQRVDPLTEEETDIRFRGDFLPKVRDPQMCTSDAVQPKPAASQKPLRVDARHSLRSETGCSSPGAIDTAGFAAERSHHALATRWRRTASIGTRHAEACPSGDGVMLDDPAAMVTRAGCDAWQCLWAEGAVAALREQVDALEGELRESREKDKQHQVLDPITAGADSGRIAKAVLRISLLVHVMTGCVLMLQQCQWLLPWPDFMSRVLQDDHAQVSCGGEGGQCLASLANPWASTGSTYSAFDQSAPNFTSRRFADSWVPQRRRTMMPAALIQRTFRRLRRAARRSKAWQRTLKAHLSELEQDNEALRQRLQLFQDDIDDAITKGRGVVCWRVD